MIKKAGFTMAEILLSLTIIGVVAAITLPSLMANINERTWNTQRKALYARMSQAIAMMPSVGGYGEYEGTNTNGVVTATKDTAAEAFLTEGLSKVLKINNICDAEHLADCGVPSSYTNLTGTTKKWPTKLSELNIMFTSTYLDGVGLTWTNTQNNIDTKAAAFETLGGESIALYYNPYCLEDSDVAGFYALPTVCANFIYDLNGVNGPNTFGKDVGFISVLYPKDTYVVAPMPLATIDTCDAESRLPNREELSAMFTNSLLIGSEPGTHLDGRAIFWSSVRYGTNAKWSLDFRKGHVSAYNTSTGLSIWCIKR